MSDAYDTIIIGASRRYGVPAALIKAVIRAESSFNPRAEKYEAKLKDSSFGLMQILTKVAGLPKERLLDPATNIDAGTRHLASVYNERGRDLAKTISSYNGGYRPHLGLGAPLTGTQPQSIILNRDDKGNVTKRQTVQPGEYANADYVRKILAWAAEYEQGLAKLTATVPPMVPADSIYNQARATVKGGTGAYSLAAKVAAGGAGVALLVAGAVLVLSKKAGI